MTDRRSVAALEITGLLALAAVARRTLAGAAAELGVAPATVLDRIRRLETATGRPLLERDGAAARLNSAGRLLAEHGQAIAGALAAARADLGALRDGRRGTVRLGVAADVPDRLAGALVAELASLRSGVRCVAAELGDRDEALAALTALKHDAILVAGPPPPAPLDGAVFAEDPWVLLVAAGSPLAERGEPVEAAAVGALPRVRGVGASAQALVAAGLGTAVLPRSDVDVGHPGTVAIDLGHLRAPLPLSLVWRAGDDAEPAVGALREAAAATSAQLAAQRALMTLVLR